MSGSVTDLQDPTGSKIAVVVELLPARYADLKTTPLTVEPVAEQATTLDLALTTKP